MKNHPDLWLASFPRRAKDGHKYDNGHALIYGATELTGATRLAAESCARIGAGLTTVIARKKIANIYRAALPAHIMVRDNLKWNDSRVTARLYGPGGLPVRPDYKSGIATVLDADALKGLPKKLPPGFVLTPHEGEFERAFPDIKGSREARALDAASRSNAIIVLKGSETAIAAPDGRLVINKNAPPSLATAGTGDVLAGMITGLLAQKMEPFDAACAAVWVHAEAARLFGPGLVASDIAAKIPCIYGSIM